MADTEILGPIKNLINQEWLAVLTASKKSMVFRAIGYKTKSIIHQFQIGTDDADKFFDCVPDIFDSQCKAIIMDINQFKPAGYNHAAIFGFQLAIAFDRLCRTYYFYSDQSLFLSALLISAKIAKPSKGDVVLFVIVEDAQLTVFEYQYTAKGYEKLRIKITAVHADEMSAIREKVLGRPNWKPKHIVLCGETLESELIRKLKKSCFQNDKLVCLNQNAINGDKIKNSLKISKFVVDKCYTKYHVIPKCAWHFKVFAEDSLIDSHAAGDDVPYIFTKHATRTQTNYYLKLVDDETGEEFKIVKLYNGGLNRHRSKVLFKITEESFPAFYCVPVIIDLINDLPPKLDKLLTKRIPVIIMFDNVSVICYFNKETKKYCFLEGWNGCFGTDATIYYDTPHVNYGAEALKISDAKPECLMRDLFSAFYMMNEEFDEDRFPALAGGNKEKRLCEFMTKFLEQHLTELRTELGETPTEIAFWLLLVGSEEEKNRFKDRLVRSFKPMNLNCHILKLEIPQ